MAVRGAEAVVATVQEESHGFPGTILLILILGHVHKLTDATIQEQPVDEGAGRGSIDQGGFAAKRSQQGKASGLTGLRLRGADIEVRGGAKDAGTPGISHPQSEGGELVLIADEVFADQRCDGIELLSGVEVGILRVHGGESPISL